MKQYIFVILFSCAGYLVPAQEKMQVQVLDQKSKGPLEYVIVSTEKNWLATTDSLGLGTCNLPKGQNRIIFTLTGYEKLDTVFPSVPNAMVKIELKQIDAELDEVTVSFSSRNNQAIESSPLKVEVLGSEEVSEEASIRPANIASILGDVSGVQIQQSSVTSGNSSVRIQGLEGKYTQILRDGMPLYDGFSGNFGILSIPPLDLKQIELVKGSASTLYGGGAIGGLVNIISKTPTEKQNLDALVNYTTLGEANANIYASRRGKKFGYTFFGGYGHLEARDVNDDGLSDVPGGENVVLHPKVFFYPSEKTSISAGYQFSYDVRKGGDMHVLNGDSNSLHSFYEYNTSHRSTGEYDIVHKLGHNIKLELKGSLSHFNLEQNTSEYGTEIGRQINHFNELSVVVPSGENCFVAGVNYLGDEYKKVKPDYSYWTVKDLSATNSVLGGFAQYTYHWGAKTILEGGFRLDNHNVYGLFPLPRVSAFRRLNDHFATRVGIGMGYKAPNPRAPYYQDYNVAVLEPVYYQMKPERSLGLNAEMNYKKEWGAHSTVFINEALFYTEVQNPTRIVPSTTLFFYRLINLNTPAITKGSDTYIKVTLDEWELYFGYTFTFVGFNNTNYVDRIYYTPQNRWAFVAAKEFKKKLRLGLEGSYTGQQIRFDNTLTPGYMFLAGSVQYKLNKHFMIMLNGENLLDYRMSREESLFTGTVSVPYFKTLWAPIDGRVINVSLRWQL